MDIRKADERGVADHGWLQSRHSFSFADYFDPQQVGFSDLLVINDDRVAPGMGFGEHGHRDMEIFSYVLDGALRHRDSLGTGSLIQPGDVQLMSAGRGVRHSEFNPSPHAAVHFLQIWLLPETAGGEPAYQQRHFAIAEKRGRLRLILSPDGAEGSLRVRQDARVYAGLLDAGERTTLSLPGLRHVYVHVARGRVAVNGQALGEGDGARLRDPGEVSLEEGQGAEVLVFDLRPHELPQRPA